MEFDLGGSWTASFNIGAEGLRLDLIVSISWSSVN